MENERCDNCQFCRMMEPDEEGKESVGFCERFPPVYVGPHGSSELEEFEVGSWGSPVVGASHWCGEWKAKATNPPPASPATP